LQAINMVIHKVIHSLWITPNIFGPRFASTTETSVLSCPCSRKMSEDHASHKRRFAAFFSYRW
jgi:hypothetical protein